MDSKVENPAFATEGELMANARKSSAYDWQKEYDDGMKKMAELGRMAAQATGQAYNATAHFIHISNEEKLWLVQKWGRWEKRWPHEIQRRG